MYQAGLRIPGAAQQVRLYQVGLSALASTTAAVRLYNAGLNLASPSAWPLYGRKGGAWVTFQEYRRVAGVWTRIV